EDNLEETLTGPGTPHHPAGDPDAPSAASDAPSADPDAPSSAARPRELADPELAEFLTAWLAWPGIARLLVTSRYRFTLPRAADQQVEWRHLGPLTEAETRKLVWSLPRLDVLDEADISRGWRPPRRPPPAPGYPHPARNPSARP